MKKIIFWLLAAILFINTNLIYAFAEGEYTLKVNRVTNCVTAYDSSGTAVKAMVCSVGKAESPTPTGTYSTSQKLRWHALFGNEYGQYCTRINGHILFHSVPYFSQNENDLNTANYNCLGTADSMGCIRLNVSDAKWIYDNCPIGTTVTIFDGTEADDPLGKPEAIKLGANAPYPTWDPADPNENNPYNSLGTRVKSQKNVRSIYQTDSITREELIEYLCYGVNAYDTANNEIDFTVETEADPSKAGVYTVTYKATDALGRYSQTQTLFIVLPSELILNVSLK
ncbi:MAG: L,D-transpeptidase [Clostridiales bacterium]|nr:L,D-transpeptidase [Clostridiales bacterium]